MQLFMDVHEHVEGLTAEGIAQAHQADLDVQAKHGVECRGFWYDLESGTVFCLVAAPSAEAAEAVHRDAHGLLADRVVPVTAGG